MAIYNSNHIAYGIRIADNAHETIGWDLRDKLEEGLADTPVRLMEAGAHDQQMGFLVINDTWKTLEAGQYLTVGPYAATDTTEHPYPEWDWNLTSTAEKFKLPTLSAPAWMFIPTQD